MIQRTCQNISVRNVTRFGLEDWTSNSGRSVSFSAHHQAEPASGSVTPIIHSTEFRIDKLQEMLTLKPSRALSSLSTYVPRDVLLMQKNFSIVFRLWFGDECRSRDTAENVLKLSCCVCQIWLSQIVGDNGGSLLQEATLLCLKRTVWTFLLLLFIWLCMSALACVHRWLNIRQKILQPSHVLVVYSSFVIAFDTYLEKVSHMFLKECNTSKSKHSFCLQICKYDSWDDLL
jgi:hypothetical protein